MSKVKKLTEYEKPEHFEKRSQDCGKKPRRSTYLPGHIHIINVMHEQLQNVSRA